MVFDRNEKKQVVALLGAGSMGTAIVRRIAAGKKILLGDISEKALERVSDDFRRSGYDVETQVVNALEKESVEAFAKRAAVSSPASARVCSSCKGKRKPSEIVINQKKTSPIFLKCGRFFVYLPP
jgi:3-hydroxyacyl-CoA dehydrogenase